MVAAQLFVKIIQIVNVGKENLLLPAKFRLLEGSAVQERKIRGGKQAVQLVAEAAHKLRFQNSSFKTAQNTLSCHVSKRLQLVFDF